MRILAAAIACLSLAACASGPSLRERMLKPTADPSEVVATELAFARAAQEDGQWTAFRDYAADGAIIFGRNGAIPAEPWLKAQQDPPQAVSWEPYSVWSSCDGSIAVTQGGFRDPDGTVGTFNTVWQRQKNGKYKWLFDFGYPTANESAAPEMIAGSTADCQPAAAPARADPAMALHSSRDGTLSWGFVMTGEGTRRYTVWLARNGAMKPVVEVMAAPDR